MTDYVGILIYLIESINEIEKNNTFGSDEKRNLALDTKKNAEVLLSCLI